jgi:hypothetical protein
MLKIKGETKVDYFHFLCTKCGEAVNGELGKDGAVPTIDFKCRKCRQETTLKLWGIL